MSLGNMYLDQRGTNNSSKSAMPTSGDNEGRYGTAGLTKREHFAGLAMQGILAFNTDVSYSDAAIDAVRYADALFGELEK